MPIVLYRRAGLFLLLIALFVAFSMPMQARADDLGPTVVIAATSLSWVTVLQLLVIPVLLPAAVGLVNRVATLAPFLKRLLLALLALASQVLTELLKSAAEERAYDLWLALFLGVVAYAVAELTYQKFYTIPLNRNVGEHRLTVDADLADGLPTASVKEVEPVTLASKLAGK